MCSEAATVVRHVKLCPLVWSIAVVRLGWIGLTRAEVPQDLPRLGEIL